MMIIKETYPVNSLEDLERIWNRASAYYYDNFVAAKLLDFNVNIKLETGDIEDGIHLEITHKYEH